MENSVLDLFSESTKGLIAAIKPEAVRSIDDLLRIQDSRDKSHKLHAILDSWSKQQSEERKLRRLYAVCFVGLLFFQIIVATVVFILISFGCIFLTESQFNTFFVAVFCEIVALTLIVTKYLFNRDADLKLIEMIKGM